jgi:hypothetical protein
VPALIYLLLFLFLDMVQPVFFVQEKLATAMALYDAVLVGFLGMAHKLVVALEPSVAFLAFVLVKEAHETLCAKCAKKMTEKERVATPLLPATLHA